MNAWTVEKLQEAAKLWQDKKTASQIAKIVGVTRNAVIGVSQRRRDLFPERMPPESMIERLHQQKLEKLRLEAEARLAAEVEVAPAPRVEYQPGIDRFATPDADDFLAGDMIPLLKLTDRTCRWPVTGGGADTLFCGDRIELGKIYCGIHRAKSVARRCEEAGR